MLEEKDSWVAGLLHDCLRFISVVAFFVISAVGAVASGAELPVRVVFDTDLGNDIDDALALQMLINYENEGRIQIAGISLSKANPLAADVVVDYYRRFGSGNPEFGYVGDGPNPEEGNFLRLMSLALNKNQSKNQNQNTIEGTGKKKVCKSDAMDEGWKMLRRVLMSSPDSSVVFIAVGPATNLARLLDSAPDSVSPLSGVALVAQKVRRLCLMGGNYSDNASAEWNVLQDLPSMQRVFEAWPGEIVASGFEVGNGVVYSHENILEDFAPCHPLRVGYENFIPMPYDRPCWDLTAVLCAVEPGAGWFDLSEPGWISVDSAGITTFPWRVIGTFDNEADILSSELVWLLASEKDAAADFSWVRPGKVLWDWWNCWDIYGVDFTSGINTDTYLYLIDYAAKHGLEYLLMDEGWSAPSDLLTLTDGIDMERICRHAADKGVGVLLWVKWFNLDRQMTQALDQMARWGVKGIKIDFMDRNDARMVDFYERTARECASRKMMVNFHGAFPDTSGNHQRRPRPRGPESRLLML